MLRALSDIQKCSSHQKWSSLANRLEKFANLLAHAGVHKTPYTTLEKELFLGLSPDSQLNIVKRVQRYSEVYFIAANSLRELTDSKRLLKAFLSLNKLRFPGEFEGNLVPGTVEEIYDADLVQEYGNLEFLRLCNYPLLQIFLMPFPKLYHRDEAIARGIVEHCLLVTKNTLSFQKFPTGKHLMREVSSEKKIFFEIEHIEASALVDDQGQATHFFCNQWARIAEINTSVQIIH